MAVGYALLAQELTINGNASIDSTWRVEITNITQKELVGGVTEKSKSYTATTANFDIGFTQPGDYVIYDIEVTNSGTLDAVISNINVVTDNNPAIIYTTSGLKRGDTIEKNGNKKYLTVKIEYDSNVTSQPALDDNDITIQMDYQQDLGQVPAYEAYSIGDTVEFAGSNWYVIEDSTLEEDYVTLMKETVLTHTELGTYEITHTCTERDLNYSQQYGCTAVGNTVTTDTMGYNWTETCHNDNYGYTTYDSSNCSNIEEYSSSKIKEFLEGTYINTLGADNLKKVDGYKIRLITLEELQSNLGVAQNLTASWYNTSSSDSLKWVYQNFGEGQNEVYGYWTMTPCSYSSGSVLYVSRWEGRIGFGNSNNIIKSAIE